MGETLGMRLKRLREERGLEVNRAADLLGIQPGQIRGYEKGRMYPSVPTLEWLCEFFGVTATELLGF